MNYLFVVLKDGALSKLAETFIEKEEDKIDPYLKNSAREIIHVYDDEDLAMEQMEILSEQYPEHKFSLEKYFLILDEVTLN